MARPKKTTTTKAAKKPTLRSLQIQLTKLQNQMDEKDKLIKTLQTTTLRPRDGETFYRIGCFGVDSTTWDEAESDNQHYELGNCFKTRDEALLMESKLKALQKLRELANGYVPNFASEGYDNYFVGLDSSNEFCVHSTSYEYRPLGLTVYFDSESKAASALSVLKEDLKIFLK